MSRNIIRTRKRKVKALITAAGRGKRFGAVTRTTNKCLLSVAGKPLLDQILERLEEFGIRNVTIVTGYQAQRLASLVNDRAKTIYNPFYSVSGLLGSFWSARHELSGFPFVFTTSDHYFETPLLESCCYP